MQIRTVHRAVRHDRLKTTELPIKGCVAKVPISRTCYSSHPFIQQQQKSLNSCCAVSAVWGVGIKLLSTTEMIMGLGECTDHQRVKYTG